MTGDPLIDAVGIGGCMVIAATLTGLFVACILDNRNGRRK